MTTPDTPSIKVSFYVLGASKAQDVLGFICDLTQKALNNSSQTLLILMDDETQLKALDTQLWSAAATSFIPHVWLTPDEDGHLETQATLNAQSTQKLAPVLLAHQMPDHFEGMVLNTTAQPVNNRRTATQNVTITRILEIITPDDSSVKFGRDKYKHYQQLGHTLSHFKV